MHSLKQIGDCLEQSKDSQTYSSEYPKCTEHTTKDSNSVKPIAYNRPKNSILTNITTNKSLNVLQSDNSLYSIPYKSKSYLKNECNRDHCSASKLFYKELKLKNKLMDLNRSIYSTGKTNMRLANKSNHSLKFNKMNIPKTYSFKNFCQEPN